MKWALFTGTWKLTNKKVEEDVRSEVRNVLAQGCGIVTGGATGVDYFAMDECMQLYPDGSRLKVIIPAILKSYIVDYRTNWCIDHITQDTITELESILERIKKVNPDALVEMQNDTITQEHYNLRHDEEVKLSNEVYAFQVNDSTGTQDTIDKAIKSGLPISVYNKYTI